MTHLEELRASDKSRDKQILDAMNETLSHFEIPSDQRDLIGEALLRFRLFKDQNVEFSQDDGMMQKFLLFDEHFSNLLKEAVKPREVPTAQTLTGYELEMISTDHLFQRLWTKAVGGHRYDKREWAALEGRLVLLQKGD